MIFEPIGMEKSVELMPSHTHKVEKTREKKSCQKDFTSQTNDLSLNKIIKELKCHG